MTTQASQAAVPAHAKRARAELLPPVIHVRNMAQPEPGPAFALLGQPQFDPAGVAAHLPGRVEAVRRVAPSDGPARVAGELVPAAGAQVAADRKEPARD